MGCSIGHIQILRGFESDFQEQDPVLKAGELAYSLDGENCIRIGNGVGAWSTLPEACPSGCVEPCTKTFRLYSKTNYQYTDSNQSLPEPSGFPIFDTKIDVPNNSELSITFSQSIQSGGLSINPDTIMPNGQKATFGIINGEIVASGSSYRDMIENGGRLFVGINDDNYEDNDGYFLVKVENGGSVLLTSTIKYTTPLSQLQSSPYTQVVSTPNDEKSYDIIFDTWNWPDRLRIYDANNVVYVDTGHIVGTPVSASYVNGDSPNLFFPFGYGASAFKTTITKPNGVTALFVEVSSNSSSNLMSGLFMEIRESSGCGISATTSTTTTLPPTTLPPTTIPPTTTSTTTSTTTTTTTSTTTTTTSTTTSTTPPPTTTTTTTTSTTTTTTTTTAAPTTTTTTTTVAPTTTTTTTTVAPTTTTTTTTAAPTTTTTTTTVSPTTTTTTTPIPTGACCFSDFTCVEDVTSDDCFNNLGGSSFLEGFSCAEAQEDGLCL